MRQLLAAVMMSALVFASAVSQAPKKKPTASSAKKKKKTSRPAVAKQTQPDAARSRAIQEALQRAGYLATPPSGKWDAATAEAMTRYQKDQGYSATGKPDARSLIKLGLGPKHENQYQPPPSPN